MNDITLKLYITEISGVAGGSEVRVWAVSKESWWESFQFRAPMGLIANSKVGDEITVQVTI